VCSLAPSDRHGHGHGAAEAAALPHSGGWAGRFIDSLTAVLSLTERIGLGLLNASSEDLQPLVHAIEVRLSRNVYTQMYINHVI
jgi:hypothetical protein